MAAFGRSSGSGIWWLGDNSGWLAPRGEGPHERHARETKAEFGANCRNARADRAQELSDLFRDLVKAPLKQRLAEARLPSGQDLAGVGADLAVGSARRLAWHEGMTGLADLVLEESGTDPSCLMAAFPAGSEDFGGGHSLTPLSEARRWAEALGVELLAEGKIWAFGPRAGKIERLAVEGSVRQVRAALSRVEGAVLISVTSAQRWAGEEGKAKSGTKNRHVLEGVEFVRSGGVKNANQAAKAMIAKYGVASQPYDAAQRGAILAISEDAAVDGLGRKIRTALKNQ